MGRKVLVPAAPSCAALSLNHCSTRRDCLAFHLENRDLLPWRGLLLAPVPICRRSDVCVCVFVSVGKWEEGGRVRRLFEGRNLAPNLRIHKYQQ